MIKISIKKTILILFIFLYCVCGTTKLLAVNRIFENKMLDTVKVLKTAQDTTITMELELNRLLRRNLDFLKTEKQFTPLQSCDVKIKGICPLSDTGKLIIPLRDLSEDFCFPYKGARISNYGPRGRRFHSGVDIKAVPKDTIRATMSGIVRMSKPYSGYGNLIVIQHGVGLETLYSHNAKNLVSVNDRVDAGQPIALAGRTGRATTEHLHFEVRVDGEAINPNKFLDFEKFDFKKSDTLFIYKNRLNKIIVTNSIDSKTDSTKASSPNLINESEAVYYKVKSGDTLWAIAKKYNTTVNNIVKVNSLSNNAKLKIGQQLKIY